MTKEKPGQHKPTCTCNRCANAKLSFLWERIQAVQRIALVHEERLKKVEDHLGISEQAEEEKKDG